MTTELSPHDWLHTVLRRQGLTTPDGRPLYAYRIEIDEFSLLRMILFGDAVSSRERCALFCIYIAEWWRKRYDGGSWSWSDPLASIDITDDYTRLYRPIQRGLQYWRRPLVVANGARQFLVTLCCEGGLPLNLLAHESHALGDFFRRLLDEQARSELPRAALPAVASHIAAATLSPRLRSDQVYELASDLVDAVSQLRPHLPDSGDPLVALDRSVPGWRDRMPLELADKTAMRLFQTLSQYAAGDQISDGDIRSARKLIPFQNLFYLSWLMREAERGVSDSLGAKHTGAIKR